MATVVSTDTRVIIQPEIVTPEFDKGPGDSVAANAVLLTREYLRTLGSYPPRVSQDWDCKLFMVQLIAGVETAIDLTDMTIAGTYWDDVIRVAVTRDVPKPVGTAGQLDISFDVADAPTAGMYRFLVTATETELFDLCSGWIEINYAQPAVV